jgi:hypothetical protein
MGWGTVSGGYRLVFLCHSQIRYRGFDLACAIFDIFELGKHYLELNNKTQNALYKSAYGDCQDPVPFQSS